MTGQEPPACYDAGDVFAMPCRTRRAGLDVEGLGIVYLEASAAGLPVIGGDSGGAPGAIREGESGYVVPGRSVAAMADRIARLICDLARSRAMEEQGLAWPAASGAGIWQPPAGPRSSAPDQRLPWFARTSWGSSHEQGGLG